MLEYRQNMIVENPDMLVLTSKVGQSVGVLILVKEEHVIELSEQEKRATVRYLYLSKKTFEELYI